MGVGHGFRLIFTHFLNQSFLEPAKALNITDAEFVILRLISFFMQGKIKSNFDIYF
jgi:hypothetical protein